MDLVVLSVSALGFGKQGASLKDIYARAKSLGLRFALPRSDRNYRLQYLEQPPGEVLHIAMDRIAKYDGNLVSLALENGEWGHVTAVEMYPPALLYLSNPGTAIARTDALTTHQGTCPVHALDTQGATLSSGARCVLWLEQRGDLCPLNSLSVIHRKACVSSGTNYPLPQE